MKVLRFVPLLGLWLAGCSMYVPQSSDIPLIEKKNDLRVDAGFGIPEGASATVSYGVSDKIAAQVFGTTSFEGRYFFHGAVGYYKKLQNTSVMELYAGGGTGFAESSGHEPWSPTDTNDFQHVFTQLNYGRTGKTWDYGFGLKSGLLHANGLIEYPDDPDAGYPGESRSYTLNKFFLAPSMIGRVGGNHLKFYMKLSGLFIASDYNDYWPVNLSFGFNYRL